MKIRDEFSSKEVLNGEFVSKESSSMVRVDLIGLKYD
jgi:hypothetical protein